MILLSLIDIKCILSLLDVSGDVIRRRQSLFIFLVEFPELGVDFVEHIIIDLLILLLHVLELDCILVDLLWLEGQLSCEVQRAVLVSPYGDVYVVRVFNISFIHVDFLLLVSLWPVVIVVEEIVVVSGRLLVGIHQVEEFFAEDELVHLVGSEFLIVIGLVLHVEFHY